MLYHTGVGYRTLCVAKSALSSILSVPHLHTLSSHPLIKRFMKGVFNSKPPTPRNPVIWDAGQLITYIKNMGGNATLSFKNLTHKLTALLMLLSAQRVNYVSSFSVKAMDLHQDSCTFYPTKLLKQSRPSYLGNPVHYRSYPHDSTICVIATLQEYLDRRKHLTTADQLLVTYVKPHKPAHRDTIARWLKNMLHWAGINCEQFKAHSYRSASTSSAKAAHVPITDILQQGQWLSEKTWRLYYDREIQSPSVPSATYADSLLQH